LEQASDEFTAYLPDLTVLTFGGQQSNARVTTSRGSYAWYLTKAVSWIKFLIRLNMKTQIQEWPRLVQVTYGLSERLEFAHCLKFGYRPLERPILSHEAGQGLNLSAAVSEIQIFSKNRKTKDWSHRYTYSFHHRTDPIPLVSI
jgi:hypothetical protein